MNTRTKEQMLDVMIKLNKKNKQNTDEKKLAVMLIKNAVKSGNKIFSDLPLTSLKVDSKMYQRPIQRHVKSIAQNWKDDKCDPLLVNYREDGFFYIIDGQHRYESAKMRGMESLVCSVLVGLSIKEEADLFVEQNNDTKKLSPYDTFKANLCRKDARDLAIAKVCENYGIQVVKSNKPKTLKSVTAARRIVSTGSQNYDPETLDSAPLEWIFDVFQSAKWDGFKETYSSAFLYSLDTIYHQNELMLDYIKTKLVRKMSESTPRDILSLANVQFPQYQGTSTKLIKLFDMIIDHSTEADISRKNFNVV